jgi:chromosome partitioning protein
VAVANFKGGVGKTSTCGASGDVGGARWLPGAGDRSGQPGLDDLDLRGRVADEWQTVFPLLARHYARHLQAENQARLARGEAPLPLDDTLSEALKITAPAMSDPEDALAQHRPDRRAAEPLLGRVPDPVWRMRRAAGSCGMR